MDERAKFVVEAGQGQVPFRDLCERYGISRKTGYKWLGRAREGGVASLADRSTRPHSSPAGLPEATVCQIVALKVAHRHWGPRKIRMVYARRHGGEALPSESTFKRVLERVGLVERRTKRRSSEASGRLRSGIVAEGPNDVWTVDFKGWWRLRDGHRCEPLTIRDLHSRFILCADPVGKGDTASVRARFEAVFARYGLPRAIRSDNGPPFASPNGFWGLSRLAVWWLALGIELDRIAPGRPDQNGSHERMHRDLAREVEAAGRDRDLEAQRAALEVWRETYNRERPHEALGNRVPADLYVASTRRFRGTPGRLEYPPGFSDRLVQPSGMMWLDGRTYFLTSALGGWNVGLRQESGREVGVWFGGLRLGFLDLETESFQPGAWPGERSSTTT